MAGCVRGGVPNVNVPGHITKEELRGARAPCHPAKPRLRADPSRVRSESGRPFGQPTIKQTKPTKEKKGALIFHSQTALVAGRGKEGNGRKGNGKEKRALFSFETVHVQKPVCVSNMRIVQSCLQCRTGAAHEGHSCGFCLAVLIRTRKCNCVN